MRVDNNILDKIERDSKYIENIVREISNKEIGFIDDYIEKIKISLDEEDLSINELNTILIRLCSFYYFLVDKQESASIKGDIASMVRDERYNSSFLESQGTIAKKQALAESNSMEENIVSKIYNSVYKTLKYKRESVSTLIDAIKKVISSKVIELGRG
jgi:hypothetical protein|nr:MAG TPA: hypothetical protein [Caudoviricetes sp.]